MTDEVKTMQYVQNAFRDYYIWNPPEPPRDIQHREWGFGSWEKKIETRHVQFNSHEELTSFLIRNTPFYISYSAAYYSYPDRRPMEKKEWKGADLIFDLDTDGTKECRHPKGWVCEKCMEMIREETVKLIEEFLISDFGIQKDKISLNFSGSRGYHVHISGEDVLLLESKGRREIADYITGNGIDYGSLFYKGERLMGPKLSEGGWRGKIANAFFRRVKEKRLEEIGIGTRMAKKFYEKEEAVIAGIERGNWDVVNVKGKENFWKVIVDAERVNAADRIDQNVTCDTSKLIRLPQSLHGGTGLVAKKVSVNDLSSFNPLHSAVVLGEREVRVFVKTAPEFELKGNLFGPFLSEEVVLPEYAAVFLMCKGAATLVGEG